MMGGFDLGFERAGFEVKWQVEIDPWCRKVLAKNFPKAERFEDVRTVGAHNLSRVDVVVGGFPCQDISRSGNMAGIDGKRSGLWSEYKRILRALRPQYALIENVAALVGLGLERVLCDLAEIGFDAEWQVISAADVGAPHIRERVWILAYPRYAGIYERGVNSVICRKGDSLEQVRGMSYRGNTKYRTKYWPTPTAHNAKETNAPSESLRNTPTLAAQAGGNLNPVWVEWLMGYPSGWTALGDSETP